MPVSTLPSSARLWLLALACAGSGKGVGIVGEAAAGVISEDPGKFSPSA